jgi:predicted dehydrogenase
MAWPPATGYASPTSGSAAWARPIWTGSLPCPGAEIVALCDLDQTHLAAAMKKLGALAPGSKADAYGDFRRVLDRKDIDAVTIATPDHWHAQIAALAFQAGKDVYGEKPLSYDAREGRLMLDYQQRYNRVFQLGTQIHAGDNYHRVVEIVRSGVLGNIDTVRLWKTGRSPGLGFPAARKPPKELDWDMWLGPAPKVEYVPERSHKTYRYFLDYSGGVYADFWCHIADILFWALEPRGLTWVSARGADPYGIADAPEWLEAEFRFDGLRVFWTSDPPDVPGAASMGIGAWFAGDKGMLLCDYTQRSITINGEVHQDLPEISKSLPRSPGHQQDFLDAVRSRNQPASNLAYARQMTLPMHLGLISYRLGRPLSWDPAAEKFAGDPEADRLLAREYRKKWDARGPAIGR